MFLLLDDLNNKDMSMRNKAGGKSAFTLRCHNAHNAGDNVYIQIYPTSSMSLYII